MAKRTHKRERGWNNHVVRSPTREYWQVSRPGLK
jgi:hypothetical protein